MGCRDVFMDQIMQPIFNNVGNMRKHMTLPAFSILSRISVWESFHGIKSFATNRSLRPLEVIDSFPSLRLCSKEPAI